MGNTCYCNGSQQQEVSNQDSNGDMTPRLWKPEKMPSITNAVKQQSKRGNIEKQNFQNIKQENNRILLGNQHNTDSKSNLNGVIQQNNHQRSNQELQLLQNSINNYNKQQQPPQSIDNISKKEEVKEPQKPLTLYEKLGGENGVKTFTEKTLDRVVLDPQLSQYFKNANMDLLKEKFRLYITHLVGANQYWIGKSMNEAHKNIPITDQIFDAFISLCVQSLKEMRVKHDCLKETVRTLQTLRDNLVKKPEELVVQKSIYEEIGGLEKLKEISELTMKKVISCPQLSQHFQYADTNLHERRLAYYLQYVTGGTEEWIGKSVMQAHKGRLIQDESFQTFLQHLKKALIEFQISKPSIEKIMNKLQNLQQDIVEDRNSLTLFEKLDANNKFEPIMTSFIDKLMKDKILGQYFHNNKMKHCISNKIVLFFAYNKGIMNPDDMKSLKEYHKILKMNIFDFERSIVLFKQALYENNIDQYLVEETLNFYKTMRKDLVWDDENEEQKEQNYHDNLSNSKHYQQQNLLVPEVNGCPFNKKDETQQKDSSKIISSFKLESNSLQKYPPSNINSIQNEVDKINKQIEEENARIKLLEEERAKEEALKLQEQEREERIRKEQEFLALQEKENIVINDEKIKQEVDEQLQQFEQSILGSRQQSPSRKKMNYKYLFNELMADSIIYEGQLQRFMDKQKSQLPRWLILKQRTLLIYKDQMSSKSFPLKPLYCIPLTEIKVINQKENLLHPNQRKSQALHFIEIELKECYGFIASSVAQLLTGNTVLMGGGQQQQGKSNQKIQNHDYSDTMLIFVSQSKKEILSWIKKLKSVIKLDDKTPEIVLTLYERIGGETAISALVEGMYQKIFTDPDLVDFFRKTNKEHQKEMQRQFLTYVTGGKKDWQGKSMQDAHKGRGIRKFEFNKVATHVVTTLQELGVQQNLIQEITQLLLSVQDDVIDEEQKDNDNELNQSKKTIYEKIGGDPAIRALVNGMYIKIFNDPELKDFFKKTKLEHQKEMQRQFLTYATGGSSEWKGKSMFEAHKGRGIGGHEFDKVALHVVTTLQELKVSQELINDIVSLLLPLKKQITEDFPSNQSLKQQQSLFERLGGQQSIDKLVEGMYEQIFNDPILKDYFTKTNKEHMKEMQKQFLTYATGGSEEWKGKSMKNAHQGRGIGKLEYEKTIHYIVKTLIEMQVPQELIDEIAKLIEPLYNDIIDF